MKIANIEVIQLKMPFSRGIEPTGDTGILNWSFLDFCLIRVETDEGLVGWGDAFCFACREPVASAVETMVAPKLIGRDVSEIAQISYDLQQSLHLFGRYGITMFAISGVDIALWDLAAKAAGLPLCRLLGGSTFARPEAYASLFRYGDPEQVADRVKTATGMGYDFVKLHEVGVAEVAAAREAGGPDTKIMVDTNCPWTPEQAKQAALSFKPYDIHWLEEPIFPPDDYAALAKLRQETGIALAAGENICTAVQFDQMFRAGSVDYAQPSVTKVGGISEFRKVATLAEAYGVQIMAHSPYFGPGFLATLHLAASMPHPGLIERIFIEPEAQLYPQYIHPTDGSYAIPTGPGVGPDPDADVIKDYRVS
jgi:D-galactarolactone cycloisomerase